MTAPVLCVRREGRCWDVPRPTTFAEWVTGSLGTAPTYDDLDYHLSTLFPRSAPAATSRSGTSTRSRPTPGTTRPCCSPP